MSEGPNWAEQGRLVGNRAGTGQGAGQGGPGQNKAGQGRAGQNQAGQGSIEQGKAALNKPWLNSFDRSRGKAGPEVMGQDVAWQHAAGCSHMRAGQDRAGHYRAGPGCGMAACSKVLTQEGRT